MNRLFRTLRGPLPPRAPRFTLKYLLGLSVLVYLGYCLLTRQPALSNPLPDYDDDNSGPYHVGTVDIEVAAAAPRNFSDAVLRETGEAAFRLDTVLFTVFYPSVLKNDASSSSQRAPAPPSRGPHHLWVPRPISLHAEGYARFASISNFVTNKLFAAGLWALVGSTEIPAHVDAPLEGDAQYPSDDGREGAQQQHGDSGGRETEKKFPVIVFSHGMASMRTSYTHYLASLASRGYVVAAVEHRDGSGPGSIVLGSDGAEKRVFHAPRESIDPVPEVEELKRLQLALRQAEMEETVAVLRRIDAGHGAAVHADNRRGEGATLAGWRGRLDMEQVIVGGHSYGATLALQALRGAPDAAERPFRAGIVLDPGKASGPLNADVDVPVLVVHSQSWSRAHSLFYGRPHFETVRDLVRGVAARGHPAWFLTARGTAHTSVTDAPLIEPALLSWTTGSTVDAREGLMQYVAVSDEFLRFLRGEPREGVLALGVTHPAYDHGEVVDPAKGAGMHWQVHVAPPAEE